MSPSPLIVRSRQVLRTHARSFDLAARFLPADRRDDAAVLYAFCRLVDDLADEATDAECARLELSELRREVLSERPRRPVVERSMAILESGGVGTEPALHLIDGVLSDLGDVRLASVHELLRYCYQVAGTVGLMMCAALGVTDPRAHAFAVDLGIGMQLTNIARDVVEDAERRRVYLPADLLAAAGTSQEAVLDGIAEPSPVARVVLALLERADRYYDSADRGMHYIPLRSRLAIVVASRVYAGIGDVLRGRGGDALSGRAYTTALHKVWLVGRALFGLVRVSAQGATEHDRRLHTALRGLPGASVGAAA